jgi:O-acetyl-ADP-ribose deacetylase (regulator of RNase III)
VVLACAAALHAAQLQNAREPGSVASVALPGLGASTGRVPPEECARYMLAAYRMFLNGELDALQPVAACGPQHRLGDDASGFGADGWANLN